MPVALSSSPQMSVPRLITLPFTGSEEIGSLAVAESENIPFVVQRVYWTFDVPSAKIRGHHAHYQLEQLIVAVHGTIEFTVETLDRQRHVFVLDHPSKALYIPQLCWREIKFGPGAVLICLASMVYEEADYIRSYYDFVQLADIADSAAKRNS